MNKLTKLVISLAIASPLVLSGCARYDVVDGDYYDGLPVGYYSGPGVEVSPGVGIGVAIDNGTWGCNWDGHHGHHIHGSRNGHHERCGHAVSTGRYHGKTTCN